MKLLKSRKGFTLIELLVVIGILAVLAAIAIPSVAGLIDRANVSADKTNTNEYTNAIERFTSEYELYCQDIASGTLVEGNLDSAQGRVYNVLDGATTREEITEIEKPATAGPETEGRALYRDTKYPVNAETLQAIVENYTKTSSATFEPKQSDMAYWYSPACGVVVVAEPDASVEDLNAQVLSGKDAKGNALVDEGADATVWINLTEEATLSTGPKELTTLTAKTWNVRYCDGRYIWTDGTNLYYSCNNDQLVLNGDRWERKTWKGVQRIWGSSIWTDGKNIYYGCSHVLDGDTWVSKTWNGCTNFQGSYIWTDGKNIYCSARTAHYVLNGDTWEPKTWNGFSKFYGDSVWTDGKNIYCSNNNDQYVLNGDTWVPKTWNGLTKPYGGWIWTDGAKFYYSSGTQQYVLNGDTWEPKTWNGCTNFDADMVWTDGTKYYYSDDIVHYEFS